MTRILMIVTWMLEEGFASQEFCQLLATTCFSAEGRETIESTKNGLGVNISFAGFWKISFASLN